MKSYSPIPWRTRKVADVFPALDGVGSIGLENPYRPAPCQRHGYAGKP
jgi:hypothetical protein